MDKNTVKSQVLKQQKAFQGKWLGMNYVTYSVGQTVIPNYESVYRTTRCKHKGEVDGVQVIPIIKYKDKPSQILLIANFRPPVNKFVLEFPSGLIDDEDYQANAKRQLLEQTGYKLQSVLPIPRPMTYSDPWKSNENSFIYIGIIDGDDPSSHQKQHLQSTENIRIHILPLDTNLPKTVSKLAEDMHYGIQTKIWNTCLGLIISNQIKK